MAYIFIDESGQFKPGNHEKHFLIGSFTVGDPRRTEKAFKAWQGNKFPKKMRNLSEVKWSASGIDDTLRLKTLQHIAALDVRVRYAHLERKNIPPKNMDETGLLYANIVGETIEMYLPPTEGKLHVICDRRKLKGLTQMQFKSQLRARLIPLLPAGTTIEIEMVDSTTNGNVQIADWIVGALAWYHEEKPLGKECFTILKNNILEGKELFKKSVLDINETPPSAETDIQF